MHLRVQFLLILIILAGCGSSNQSGQEESTQTPISNDSAPVSSEEKEIILFYGNSITAGYQLDITQAFPAIIQKKIDSLNLIYDVVNAGLSGETSAGGLDRIDWVLKTTPAIFFLELGANDGLRGLPLDQTYSNLQAIIDKVKQENPEVQILIAGMMVPPNLGADYTGEFKGIFKRLAEENESTYIPFLLEGVAGNPDLNLRDGIHPTPEGHKIVAETVWNYLQPML